MIKAVQDATGVSPTRSLDDKGIQLADSTAYLRILNFESDPTKVDLRSTEHVFVSFVVDFEPMTLVTLGSCGSLKFLTKRFDDATLTLISGSLADWSKAIQDWVRVDQKASIRKVGEQISDFLKPFKPWM